MKLKIPLSVMVLVVISGCAPNFQNIQVADMNEQYTGDVRIVYDNGDEQVFEGPVQTRLNGDEFDIVGTNQAEWGVQAERVTEVDVQISRGTNRRLLLSILGVVVLVGSVVGIAFGI